MTQKPNLQIVIFGASGDLAYLKLMPALYNIFSKSKLEHFQIVGVSRRDWSDEDYRDEMKIAVKESKNSELIEDVWSEFSKNLIFHTGNFQKIEDFEALNQKLNKDSQIIYYMSVSPKFYAPILQGLKNSSCADNCKDKDTSVVIEKPFGHNYETAMKLNEEIKKVFREEQIYRIDHVLGKDTLLDILSFRKNNIIIDSILESNNVDHIQVNYLEDLGIKDRGGFYENAGVVRDMVQNHMLQILANATLNIPEKTNHESISKARCKIINNFREINTNDVVLGQYSGNDKKKAYREEVDVDKESDVPTFIAFKAIMSSERWEDTPVYFRTGKSLKQKFTEISFVFKDQGLEGADPNILSFRIQPQEGIYMILKKRKWDDEEEIENISLDFCYKHSSDNKIKGAYENLLAQVIKGDKTYFVNIEEVLGGWRLIDQINQAYEKRNQIELQFYKSGTWGPETSKDLIENDGREWYTEKFPLVCNI